VKKREVHDYTFFYLNGDEITTLVKKDGKPLSETEQKKENEKTQKRIEENQKRAAKKEAKEEKAKEEGKDKEGDEPGIEVFLRALPVRESAPRALSWQDVLVFDFEPNPEFKPHKLVEKLAQKLAGVVWVDEKAHDVGAAGGVLHRRHENCRRLAGEFAERQQHRLRAGICEQ